MTTDAERLFRHVFREGTGYFNLPYCRFLPGTKKKATADAWHNGSFYPYPQALGAALDRAGALDAEDFDVYLSVQLHTDKNRKAETAAPIWCLQNDTDHGTVPDELCPTARVESSPGRFQDYWALSRAIPPAQALALGARIAFACGTDNGGTGVEQVLRVPGTRNRTHPGDHVVRLAWLEEDRPYDPDELDRILPPLPAPEPVTPTTRATGPALDLDDTAIIDRMCTSNPDAARLWAGDMLAYADEDHPEGNHSDADAALYAHLYWWFNGDDARADAAFRRSPLYREKWERADYRERTASLARKGFTGGYTGASPRPIRPDVSITAPDQAAASPCASVEQERDYWRERALRAEAENAGLRQTVAAQQEAVRVAIADRNLAQRHNRNILAAFSNPALGPIAATFVATTSRVFSDISTNRTGADGVRLYRADLAEATGQSESTISLHLNSPRFKHFYEKKTTREVQTDRETSEVLINPATGKPRFRTVIEVWPKHLSQQAMYAAAAAYAVEQEDRGEKPEPLRKRCPHTRWLARIVCADCGEVRSEQPATEAEVLESQSAIPETAAAPTVVTSPSTSQSTIPEPAPSEVGEANSSADDPPPSPEDAARILLAPRLRYPVRPGVHCDYCHEQAVGCDGYGVPLCRRCAPTESPPLAPTGTEGGD